MSLRSAIIIGAGGGIGSALTERLLVEDDIDEVITVSRSESTPVIRDRIVSYTSDYSEVSIQGITDELTQQDRQLVRVCICNGILHDDGLRPEKRLEDVSTENLERVFRVNAFLPITWLQHLLPLMSGREECIVAVFSARVGSIEDNRLGGWYAYRASKAALNMMLKTAAIEFARRAKNIKLIAFHPGTTDTGLSRPFNRNITYRLLSPIEVADALVYRMSLLHPDGEIDFIDWEGESIEW